MVLRSGIIAPLPADCPEASGKVSRKIESILQAADTGRKIVIDWRV